MAAIIQSSPIPELLAREAINAAISLNWEDAIKLNQKILKLIKNDVEALNRLARAQLCLGKTQEAQKLYRKVLDIDPYNIIAEKNLDKIIKTNSNLHANGHESQHTNGHSSNINLSSLFLTEPGKTKMVNLLNLAQPSVIASLNCGDEVLINVKSHSVSISTAAKVYLGSLPDDLAHRIIAFIGGGNKYDAYVKSATLKTLTVFIREVSRSARFVNQPSFQAKQAFDEESR